MHSILMQGEMVNSRTTVLPASHFDLNATKGHHNFVASPYLKRNKCYLSRLETARDGSRNNFLFYETVLASASAEYMRGYGSLPFIFFFRLLF